LCRLSVCLSVISIPSTLHIDYYYYYYYYYCSNSLQRMRWAVYVAHAVKIGIVRSKTGCYEFIWPAEYSFMAMKSLDLFLLSAVLVVELKIILLHVLSKVSADWCKCWVSFSRLVWTFKFPKCIFVFGEKNV
jgi:hypothetical protein